MAQVRNISGDTLYVVHLGAEVAPGEVLTVDDTDVLQPDADGNHTHDAEYMADHPDARNWRIPGVWAVEGDPPPASTPAPVTKAAPEPAPTETPSE